MTNQGRFTKINHGFVCDVCHRDVPPSDITCRNHCPFCLTSRHVDEFPGDRLNSCGGIMKAVGYELSGKKGIVLIFKCQKCGNLGKNIAALDGETVRDDYDLILQLGQKLP